MHHSFHPFFSKQRELRGEIDRQTQEIADVKTRLSATLVELNTATEALHARIKAHEELLAEHEQLQATNATLIAQVADRDERIGKLEADLKMARSHRKKSTMIETVAQEKGAH